MGIFLTRFVSWTCFNVLNTAPSLAHLFEPAQSFRSSFRQEEEQQTEPLHFTEDHKAVLYHQIRAASAVQLGVGAFGWLMGPGSRDVFLLNTLVFGALATAHFRWLHDLSSSPRVAQSLRSLDGEKHTPYICCLLAAWSTCVYFIAF
uniref:Uncharacterized protein n=1 Tax=Chromera velia CCMP2878 TaxID=1169474 RepID=A0A0G4I442_9ALVE|eukprot:Cvel_10761.t1-p1 / transcript=Cvel_10761.t1 / gene=Cvel_10761 / organism=Chromera_velia_CCMP2878 / gene_product=hypothetical protein / transcript_product=hypothetical protein / location=Cvel_scaffold657:12810-15458(-) / protein_length=146 / sequence_SO=supercontig / SO=protein_coding / is_pseudo=false